MQFGRLKRRDVLPLLGGVLAWPLASQAQQADRARRIAMLVAAYSQSDREGQARVAAFLDRLQKLGWTDGRNVRVDYRWGGGDVERTKTAAAELVRSAPDLIVAGSNPAVAALRDLATKIPIVFAQVSDPVGSGFVAGLPRPGGNMSGFQNFEDAIGGKWLGVLKEAAPGMRRAAVLFGSDTIVNLAFLRAAEAVAPSVGVEVTAVDISGGGDIERAIAAFASKPDGGLIVVPHVYNTANRGSIIVLAARHRLPAVYPFRYFAAEGGLMSYGPDQIEQWRGAASYVDRVLRGENPGELPVQAPTKYELVINLKTAKVIGLDVPPALPLRADEVIE